MKWVIGEILRGLLKMRLSTSPLLVGLISDTRIFARFQFSVSEGEPSCAVYMDGRCNLNHLVCSGIKLV